MESRKAGARGPKVVSNRQSSTGRKVGVDPNSNKRLGRVPRWLQREVENLTAEQLNRAFLATNHGTNYAEDDRDPTPSSSKKPKDIGGDR